MSLINLISVPTSTGIKSIEIHNSDITQLGFEVDILVLSAYHNKYFPAENTVIKSLLDNTGISLELLAEKPEIDLRKPLHCWVSTKQTDQAFKRLLCIEGIKSSILETGSSTNAISDLFGCISFLNYKNIEISSIALPLLGSGFQKNSVQKVLPELINQAIHSLKINPSLNSIYFVEINSEKATLIDQEINDLLDRGKENLESPFLDPMFEEVIDEILSKVVTINRKFFNKKSKTLNDLIDKINEKSIRFFELGILGRKTLELLLPKISLLKNENGERVTIFEHIKELKTKNVADWMITYMHTIRVFGNFVAHYQKETKVPENMDKIDLWVYAQAINRFLEFYLKFKGLKKTEKST